MAVRYLSTTELKDHVHRSANSMGLDKNFKALDAQWALDEAERICGFQNPPATDAHYAKKQMFLMEAARLYFLKDARNQNMSSFDVDGIKLSHVPKRFFEEIKYIERKLEKARSAPDTAHLFMTATEFFGDPDTSGGLADDAVGRPINPKSLE